jgi:hypothetical protein
LLLWRRRTGLRGIRGRGSGWRTRSGRTNFTRGSELQNAETSAWGRAIVAALAADTRQGVASADEVRNRREEQTPEAQRARATNSATPLSDADRARSELLAVLPELELTPADAMGFFSDYAKGSDLRTADAQVVRDFIPWLFVRMSEGKAVRGAAE